MVRSAHAMVAFALAVTAGSLLPGCIGDPPAAELNAKQRQIIAKHLVDAAPEGMQELDALFGGAVRLVGCTITPKRATYSPRQSVKVTLVWQRVGRVDTGWRLFTHLRTADGSALQNLDQNGPLRALPGVTGVPLPPAQWAPTKTVLDPVRFSIPPDATGPLVVVAGLYQGRKRMDVAGRDAVPQEQLARVARLTVPSTRADSVKELRVTKLPAGTVLTLDGALSEAAWTTAADTGPFVHPGTGRASAQLPVSGRAKLLWDDASLYVGFAVTDPDVRGGFPEDAVDPHLWEKDTVEIMVDPDGDGDNRDYYEIQINPQNLVFDSRFDSYNAPRGGKDGPFGHEQWSAELQSAVQIDGTLDHPADRDQGYTVEARIPWSSFAKARRAPPRPGDRWRMNFYAMQNNGGAAWSPILGQGNFHRASRFGRVIWADR